MDHRIVGTDVNELKFTNGRKIRLFMASFRENALPLMSCEKSIYVSPKKGRVMSALCDW